MEELRREIGRVYAKQKAAVAAGRFLDVQKRLASLRALEQSIRRHEKDLIEA